MAPEIKATKQSTVADKAHSLEARGEPALRVPGPGALSEVAAWFLRLLLFTRC